MSSGCPPLPTTMTARAVAPSPAPFVAVAVAVFVRVAGAAGAWTVIVTVAVPSGTSVPSEAVTTPPDGALQLPCDALQETNVVPGGSGSKTVTPSAGKPPVFPTTIVNATIPPGATGFGRAVFEAESVTTPPVGVGVGVDVGVNGVVGVVVGVLVGVGVGVFV